MVVILFRSKLTGLAGEDYAAWNAEMAELARKQPGFLDVKSFHADDGERLTVVWWSDEETLQQWSRNLRHLEAKRLGRAKWYEYYRMEVANVTRTSEFTRETAEAAGQST